jgi:ribulose-bisphosphate carboxylase large chain
MMDGDRFVVTYGIACDAAHVEERAQAIALEQSVELPLAAVRDARIREEVVGRVDAIRPCHDGWFEVDIALATETVGRDAGQLMNMLFGNTSMQEDVALVDVDLPLSLTSAFGGPRVGMDGIRTLAGVHEGALSCTALKPQGMSAHALAGLAGTFAESGIDVIKDDHGLADQAAAPFSVRVPACQRAVDESNARSGTHALYAPSVTGSFEDMRHQVELARACGVRMVLVAPMVCGVSNLAALARESGVALLAHPSLAGATRMAPRVLLGKLFRLFGADATIFPNFGGRFGYTPDECQAIANAARQPWHDLGATLPVPAGGMTVERVPEMRARFGNDVMFLIGGSLLTAADALPARCREFVQAVRGVPKNVTPNTHLD